MSKQKNTENAERKGKGIYEQRRKEKARSKQRSTAPLCRRIGRNAWGMQAS
jgi:hypothetical protein